MRILERKPKNVSKATGHKFCVFLNQGHYQMVAVEKESNVVKILNFANKIDKNPKILNAIGENRRVDRVKVEHQAEAHSCGFHSLVNLFLVLAGYDFEKLYQWKHHLLDFKRAVIRSVIENGDMVQTFSKLTNITVGVSNVFRVFKN